MTSPQDSPPALRDEIPDLADIDPPKLPWQDVPIPTEVVLLTVKEEEFLGCYTYLNNVKKSFNDNLSWVYFGEIGAGDELGNTVQVCLVSCFQGSGDPGAASTVVQHAIRTLRPKAVVCVGYCGGLNLKKVKLGDVVLSAKLATYSKSKVTSSGVEVRATIANVTPGMQKLIMCAQIGWKAPILGGATTKSQKPNVLCMAEIASGPQLVVDPKRRVELLKQFPEAIAIEMEGEGVYATCHELGVEWAVIKGVSDYADDTKSETENWKPFAAAMAASVVKHIFSDPVVVSTWPHYSETTSTTNQTPAATTDPLTNLLQTLLVGDNGQVNYRGRKIGYSARGRVHSLKELWVYDGEAWDVKSGITFSKNHFKQSREAIEFAIKGLIQKLKSEGIVNE